MKGKDVYVIAKGLDLDERVKLINLLKRDLVVKKKKNNLHWNIH